MLFCMYRIYADMYILYIGNIGLSMKVPLCSFCHCAQYCLLICIYRCNVPYSIRLWLCQDHIQIPCAYVLCKAGCCSHVQFCMKPIALPGCIYFNLALKWTSIRSQIYGNELHVQQKRLWKAQLGGTVEVRKICHSFYFLWLWSTIIFLIAQLSQI